MNHLLFIWLENTEDPDIHITYETEDAENFYE